MKIIRIIQHKHAHQEQNANLQWVGEQGSGTWSQYGEAAWGQTKMSGLGWGWGRWEDTNSWRGDSVLEREDEEVSEAKKRNKENGKGVWRGTGKKKDPTGFNRLMDAKTAKHLFHCSERSKWLLHKINITSESNNNTNTPLLICALLSYQIRFKEQIKYFCPYVPRYKFKNIYWWGKKGQNLKLT